VYAEPESERMKMPSLLETDFTTVFFFFYRSFSFEEPVGVALSFEGQLTLWLLKLVAGNSMHSSYPKYVLLKKWSKHRNTGGKKIGKKISS